MGSKEIIAINEDDEIWEADFEWNITDAGNVDHSIIESCKRLLRNHPIEIKLDNLAFMLSNIRWMYIAMKEEYHIEARYNVGTRDVIKEQSLIKSGIKDYHEFDIDSITISFIRNQKPIKLTSIHIIADLLDELNKIATRKYSGFRPPDKNTKDYSNYFTDSCIVDVKRFLDLFSNLRKEKLEEIYGVLHCFQDVGQRK